MIFIGYENFIYDVTKTPSMFSGSPAKQCLTTGPVTNLGHQERRSCLKFAVFHLLFAYTFYENHAVTKKPLYLIHL